MSQFFKRLQTKKKIEKENRRILTIESYHPFQSSRENQTYKIHIHFLPFAPTLRTFMRMSSYKIDWSRTESMGFLSFCVTYILLSFVRLFLSFFYPSVRPTRCLNSQKESMMMTDKGKQQLTHKVIFLEARSLTLPIYRYLQQNENIEGHTILFFLFFIIYVFVFKGWMLSLILSYMTTNRKCN